ncbi:MAG TPA: RagB/SusD family nutrient uptake outer membrane protein [Sphingobacterium sp.]|nr:hypothetical protein HMPREF3127_18400 [Sphingobacterium sp. HMSC13C05]HAT90962.1 RagB/SusD family nutrient uptake outer membrane protein [Sphingobacterium sp.]
MMMNMRNMILALLLLLMGCNPDFLELKRDKSQVIPQSLDDLDALLNDYATINVGAGKSLGTIAAGEFYVEDNTWNLASSQLQKFAYTWSDEILNTQEDVPDWNNLYKRILYANVILERLDQMQTLDQNIDYNRIKGSALFIRSDAFFSIAQQFAAPAGMPEWDRFGIPLKLESDINLVTTRSTVTQTYNQIISDLLLAIGMLPDRSEDVYSPNKVAAYMLLMRCYMQLGNYEKSLEYATKARAIGGAVLDYNTVSGTKAYPFPTYGKGNSEIIYLDGSNSSNFSSKTKTLIPVEFYNSYDDNDLRKKLLFEKDAKGNVLYKGSYLGNATYFVGYAWDELLLNEAECAIRLGGADQGINVLNELLSKRFISGKFQPIASTSQKQALELVLLERQKELLLRGIRWSDLRRLNREQDHVVILKRKVNDQEYELLPSSVRYIFPIPKDVMLKSNIEQNP